MISSLVIVASLAAPGQNALERGESLLREGRYAEAELAFQRAVEREGDSPRAHYFLGVARMRLGRPEDAVSPLERARELSAVDNPAVLYELGTAHLKTGAFEKAKEILSEASAAAPSDPGIRLQLGFTHYKLLEGESARDRFLEVLREDPAHPIAHFYLGLAEAALGKLDEAQIAFRRALELHPHLVEARLGLARTLSQSGRDGEARTELERILSSEASAAISAHNELGLLALRSGDPEGARVHFEEVVRVRPRDRQATYNLWLLYQRTGNAELAAEMKERFEASQEEPVELRSLATTSTQKKPR